MFGITLSTFLAATAQWMFLFIAVYVTLAFIAKLIIYNKTMQPETIATSMIIVALVDSLYLFIMIL